MRPPGWSVAPSSLQARVQARVKALCGQLALPASVQVDAQHTAHQLLVKLYGRGDLRVANRDKVSLQRVTLQEGCRAASECEVHAGQFTPCLARQRLGPAARVLTQ